MGDVKLHLGCGKVYIPGFIHVDVSPADHVDIVHDIRELPWDDGTVDLIYACHVIEYFDWFEVIDVLREWRRVLRIGGRLRLAVPDFSALACMYHATDDLALLWGSIYGRMEVAGSVIYHRCVYDFPTLSTTLRLAGYRNIHHWDWTSTEHTNVDDCSQSYYPHMDKDNGLLLSLNVEAVK